MTLEVINITNSASLNRAIRSRVLRENFVSITDKAIMNNANKLVDALIEKGFKQTNVWLGIDGFFAGDENNDLQAVFGLSDELAKTALLEIEESIRDSLDISSVKVIGNEVTIMVSFENLGERIKRIRSGSYISTGGETINWIDWVVDLDSPIFDAEISFDSDHFGETSRSNRAIMIRLGRGNWSIQQHPIISSFGGMLRDAIENDQWLVEARLIIRDAIRRELIS